jgi:integral membrane protein (TIGR00529 family)
LGILDPLPALIISFCFLGLLLYKRVNLGITLNATALLLALLSVSWQEIPRIVYATVDYTTSDGLLTISVVLATFGIMLLSQLYKETGEINRLSENLSRIIKNPKVILCTLPAIIGFLPVAGGALMSAPLVDSEAEKLKMKPEKKAYVNLWFRHTIFPVYPLSQLLIITVGVTEVTMASIILRQIPAVIVMIILGYGIGFWKVSNPKKEEKTEKEKNGLNSNLKNFLTSFSPIIVTIIVAVFMELISPGLAKQGFDVLIATIVGIIVLIAITKPSLRVLKIPLKSTGIYGVTLAAYGAFFLKGTVGASGISQILKTVLTNGSMDILLFLTIIPALLGFLTGSANGGIAIGASILAGVLSFSPKTAALLFMSAYLGYIIAPTHLCFAFTANYFKCPLTKIYKYVIPSFIATVIAVLLTYFLI